jgi:SAM-dependent methyltransferase
MNKTPTKPTLKTTKKPAKKAHQDKYNDPSYNYLHYWDEREYEHASEEMAIRRLLRGRRFKNAVDIGGGYGRLCLLLEKYSDKVTLAEPSQQHCR